MPLSEVYICFVFSQRDIRPHQSWYVCAQCPRHVDVLITLPVMIVPLIVCIVFPLPTQSPNRQRAPGDFTSLLTHLTSLPSSQILPSSSLISTATSPLPTSISSTDQPSSSSGQSSAAIAAGVGGGVAVALVLLIVAVLLVILVVFVMRRKQGSKPLENVEHKGGFSPLGNPVYTGKQISFLESWS